MNKVFIVRKDIYDDQQIKAVLTSQTSAENYKQALEANTEGKDQYTLIIEEHVFNEGENLEFVPLYEMIVSNNSENKTVEFSYIHCNDVVVKGSNLPEPSIYVQDSNEVLYAKVYGFTPEETLNIGNQVKDSYDEEYSNN